MKKISLLLLLFLLPMAASAQTKLTIHVATAGTLPILIQNYEKYGIEELTLTGELNGTDIACIRRMAGAALYYFEEEKHGRPCLDLEGNQVYGNLTVLNISGATIVSGGDYYYHECSLGGSIWYSASTSYNCISNYMFSFCKLTKIFLPNNIILIGRNAFDGCKSLTSMIIPNSVTSIGDRAFRGCSGLTSVTIPNSVTSIGDDAFYGTAWYNNQPDGLVYAGKVAYKYKGNMPTNTNIIIKERTIGIADWAFSGCSGLTSVTIPNSVTTIGGTAFFGCSGLKSVLSEIEVPFAIDNSVFNDVPSNATLIVPKGTKSAYQSKAGWNKFANIVEIEKKQTIHVATAGTLPDLILSHEKNLIEELTITGELNGTDLAFLREMAGQNRIIYFFDDDSDLFDLKYGEYLPHETQGKLIDLDISNVNIVSGGSPSLYLLGDADEIYSSDNTIPAGLFFDCKLSSIKLPRSISNIESLALGHCPLSYITIPNSVTSISDDVFWGCSSLESMVVENSNTKYDSRNNCKAIIETESNTLIAGCKNTIIPNSVTTIGSDAFASCSGLTSVTFPNSVTSIGKSAFYNCSGLTSVTIPNSVTSIGISAFSGCNNLKYICLASDKYPSSYTLGNTTCQYIMPQSAFEAGIPQGITNYATYTVAPKYITVKSTTATTATLELTPIDLTGGSTEDATPYEVTMYGLNPGSSIKGSWELETKDRGLASIPTVTTKNLVMNVQPAQPTSKIKARLVATVNEPDDDQHFGFEWLRYDAPSIMTPNRVSAPLYEGQIVGSLNNLDPNVYYKYRPYYKSADGSMFYGEWEAFITGDADVFFEPVTHTKEASEVTGESAQLAGSWIEGTEDTEEKGFEYWPESGANTRATGENMIRVIVDGNQTTATVDGLMAGKVYGYHSYVKTASGTTYGEDKTFRTPLPGDANDNGAVDAADIVELVNAKAGHPSASFNLKNADANADGSFTEADITATADIIMKR